jgi:hypothetical protein
LDLSESDDLNHPNVIQWYQTHTAVYLDILRRYIKDNSWIKIESARIFGPLIKEPVPL